MSRIFGICLSLGLVSKGTLALPQQRLGGPVVCSCSHLIFKPVCGSDGQTYVNACILDCEAFRTGSDLTIASKGECGNPPLCICPLIVSPVCGLDGRTYSNICALKCQASKTKNLKLKHYGACKPLGDEDISALFGNGDPMMVTTPSTTTTTFSIY